MKPAIVVPAITQFVAEARELVASLHEAEEKARKVERLLGESREAAQMRRIELGHMLLRHRAQLPKRGSRESGWGAYLEAIEMDEATAWRYMKIAENPASTIFQPQSQKDNEVQPGEFPPPSDADAPIDEVQAPEPDRNSWCTPKLIADAIGPWDLDPCSNERSHIKSRREFRLDRGEDGLELANTIEDTARVFVNPPYSAGQVIRWVRAYGHTRFCFLVKIDPSTEWFRELHDRTAIILAPIGERIEFEPPPGVTSSGGVQFPHALFFAREDDASAHIRRLCFMWKPINAA